VAYAIQRWLTFGVKASQEQRTTSNCNMATEDEILDPYDRQEVGAFIEATL